MLPRLSRNLDPELIDSIAVLIRFINGEKNAAIFFIDTYLDLMSLLLAHTSRGRFLDWLGCCGMHTNFTNKSISLESRGRIARVEG